MKTRKEKTPTIKEPPKKLLVITQSANSPKTRHIADLFLSVKRESARYIDKDGKCLPSGDNVKIGNGKLEEQMKRLEASLFVYINPVKNDKIRVIFGRTHEYSIVDVAHFDLSDQTPVGILPTESTSLSLVLLSGRSESPRLQNLLLDIFRESLPNAVSIGMCTRACGIEIDNERVSLDIMKIEQSPFSLVKLIDTVTLTLIDTYHCDENIFRASKKIIRQTEKKIKNVEKGPLNSVLGTLHMEKQDLSEVKLSKGKALR